MTASEVERPFTTADFADRMFGPLVHGRECGSCVACCVDLNIDEPELAKAAGVACRHLTTRGCGIYASRPSVCRNWYCLWRRIAVMPEQLRPDHCGVTFAFVWSGEARSPFEHHFIVARANAAKPGALFQPEVTRALEMFAEAAPLPLWISDAGQKRLIFPDHTLAQEILGSASPISAKAAELRKTWKWFLDLPLSV